MRHLLTSRIAVAAAALLLVAILYVFFFRGESLEGATVRVHNAVMNGEGEPIEQHLIKDEVRAYGLSAEQYGQLIRAEFLPLLKEWRPEGEPVKEYMADTEIYSHLYRFSSRDGREAFLRIQMGQTRNGPRLISFVPNLVACISSMKYLASNEIGAKSDVFYAGLEFCKRDAQRIRQAGLEGFYDPETRSFLSWQQLTTAFQRVVDAKAKRAAIPLDPPGR